MAYDLQSIARQFRTSGEPVEIAPVPVGHINDTYLVTTATGIGDSVARASRPCSSVTRTSCPCASGATDPSWLDETRPGWPRDARAGRPRHGGGGNRYLLQRINQVVFTNPVHVMANIVRITKHIRAKMAGQQKRGHSTFSREIEDAAGRQPREEEVECPLLLSRQLEVIATRDGGAYYRDIDGNIWRMYNFIAGAVTYDSLQSPTLAREAARMFGRFQGMLIDLPGPPLHETIPGFHDTPRRLERFQEVLKVDVAHRAKNARGEIDFVFENAALCHVLSDLVQRGEIPMRVAHNDAKINNVMFDTSTGQGVCVIDLDTVMPGLSAYDFGDLVRTATCSAAEDERDLSKVGVDITLFDALARGFVAGTGCFLTPAERRHLVFGGKLITFEQLIRFLTDYLAGDVYYKVHRADHNLDRARTQMKLVQSIIEQEQDLNRLVEQASQEGSA